MPTFITTSLLKHNQPIALTPEDEHHLLKVLRSKVGEIIQVTDNAGTLGTAQVTSVNPLGLTLLTKKNGENPSPITLYLPLMEQDRLELAIEKLCELNIETVQLVATERTQQQSLKPNKWERLQKIAASAQKQCGRAWPLKILAPLELKKVTVPEGDLKIVASLAELAQPFTSIDFAISSKMAHVFIGPEGGFSPAEEKFFAENKFIKVRWGETILRAETAAIVFATLTKVLSPLIP